VVVGKLSTRLNNAATGTPPPPATAPHPPGTLAGRFGTAPAGCWFWVVILRWPSNPGRRKRLQTAKSSPFFIIPGHCLVKLTECKLLIESVTPVFATRKCHVKGDFEKFRWCGTHQSGRLPPSEPLHRQIHLATEPRNVDGQPDNGVGWQPILPSLDPVY
jgi:hypothetical protein